MLARALIVFKVKKICLTPRSPRSSKRQFPHRHPHHQAAMVGWRILMIRFPTCRGTSPRVLRTCSATHGDPIRTPIRNPIRNPRREPIRSPRPRRAQRLLKLALRLSLRLMGSLVWGRWAGGMQMGGGHMGGFQMGVNVKENKMCN